MRLYILHPLLLLFPLAITSLLIAADIKSIEHTPHIFAINDFYNPTAETPARLISGGVASLFSNPNVTLATNAETQALRQYAQHKSLRIILTSAETYYHIIASKLSNITTISDLKGKRIGVIPSTSAHYFLQKYLSTHANLTESQYTIVSGQICLAAPCGRGTFPYLFAQGSIDALALWQPSPELARLALGAENTITFHPPESLYREIVNLHSTVEHLSNPDTRAAIVKYVAAVLKTHEQFRERPEAYFGRIEEAVGIEEEVVRSVWGEHRWRGRLAEGLEEVLVEEEAWVAGRDGRRVTGKEELGLLVDGSVLEEARLLV